MLITFDSYDNSGERMDVPLWQTNSTNVARTDAVLKTIAEMFTSEPQVVSVITPLNE